MLSQLCELNKTKNDKKKKRKENNNLQNTFTKGFHKSLAFLLEILCLSLPNPPTSTPFFLKRSLCLSLDESHLKTDDH